MKNKIFEKIVSFIRKIFMANRKQIKLLGDENNNINQREEFLKQIKVKLNNSVNNSMRTHICDGDGLGIKKKITRIINK